MCENTFVHCPYLTPRNDALVECHSSFMGSDLAEAQESLDAHVVEHHPRAAARACTIIEEHVRTIYGHELADFELDPSGSDYIVSHGCGWIVMTEMDSLLAGQWERLSGDKLRRQSDEPPSFDDALASRCDAQSREDAARSMK